MATKKDYVKTAQILADIENQTNKTAQELPNLDKYKYYRALLLEQLVKHFKQDNPRFDTDRFLNYINERLEPYTEQIDDYILINLSQIQDHPRETKQMSAKKAHKLNEELKNNGSIFCWIKE